MNSEWREVGVIMKGDNHEKHIRMRIGIINDILKE